MCLPFQREYDENEVDPHHGEQKDEVKEAENMELPEDLNLEDTEEQNEEGTDEGRDTEGNKDTLYAGRTLQFILQHPFR